MQGLHSLEADFTQIKTIRVAEATLHSSGHFSLRSPQSDDFRLRWEFLKPQRSLIEIDKNVLKLTTGAFGHEKTKTVKDASFQAMTVWLRLQPQEIFSAFTVKELSKNPLEIELRPRQLKKFPFQEIHLRLDSKGYLNKVKCVEKSLDELNIEFSKIKTT